MQYTDMRRLAPSATTGMPRSCTGSACTTCCAAGCSGPERWRQQHHDQHERGAVARATKEGSSTSIVDAFRVLTPGFHLWWSGPSPQFDLADRSERSRAYELVLREGTPNDIASVVDGALLVDAWPDLILPSELRQAWQHLIDRAHTKLAQAS